MGQASSDLSTEEVEDSSPSSLGIGESLRRRGILPNLNTSNRHDTNVEEPNEESLTEHRPDGRSTGNGRYNLRIRPSTTGENMSTSTNTTENERNSVETGNDVTTQNETEDGPRRRISTSNVIQISGRRQGSSILRLEGATLRSVLAVLTGRHDNDDDDSDDSDLPRGRSRRGLFDGMRMHSQDDNDDGSNTNSSATSDDEEWVRRIAGLSRGASFTRRHRTPAKNSRKNPQKVEPDILKALESSDFSASTRQSLGMSPYPERNDPLLLLTSSKQKLSGCVDNCRISIENEDSDGEIDIETVSPRCTSKNINSMGETSKQYSAKRSCPMSPHFLKQNNTENSSINECNRLPSISSWVSSRELGNFSRSAYASPFSHGRQCFLMGKFLPNKRRKIATFSQKLFCGTYSNCGNLFLSACQDQNIRLFDTSQSKFRHRRIIRARDVGWSVLDTALSPDNRHLIYSSWCDYIYQVNLYGSDGNLIKNDNIGSERNFSNEGSSTLEDNHQALNLAARDGGDRFCIFSMRFSQDGDEILCGAKDGYIYVYDRGSNQRSLRVNAHEDDVNAVAFIDSATHILASGGDDGICKIWDRRSLKETDPVPVGLLAGHVDGITYIDPRGDGRHLITNSKDQSIKLWDLRRFSSKDAVDATKMAVKNQNWDYRWQGVPRRLMAEYIKGAKKIVDDSSLMTYRGHTVLQTLIRCRFSPAHTTAQRYIYTGCASGSVYVYDVLTGKIVRELTGHRSCVRDVSWHPYRPEITSSSWDSCLAKWTYIEDIKDKEPTTGDGTNAHKATESNVPKKPCQSSDKSLAPCEAKDAHTTEQNLNINVGESEGEETELRRSKRAKNTRL